MGFNLEAAVYMLSGVVWIGKKKTKDIPMMIHHMATLFVLMAAWR